MCCLAPPLPAGKPSAADSVQVRASVPTQLFLEFLLRRHDCFDVSHQNNPCYDFLLSTSGKSHTVLAAAAAIVPVGDGGGGGDSTQAAAGYFANGL